MSEWPGHHKEGVSLPPARIEIPSLVMGIGIPRGVCAISTHAVVSLDVRGVTYQFAHGLVCKEITSSSVLLEEFSLVHGSSFVGFVETVILKVIVIVKFVLVGTGIPDIVRRRRRRLFCRLLRC